MKTPQYVTERKDLKKRQPPELFPRKLGGREKALDLTTLQTSRCNNLGYDAGVK